MTLHEFTVWLATTGPSQTVQNVSWIIPAVQIVHILAICVVIGSALVLDLRLVGVVGRADPIARVARRYVPWMWIALVILLLTGATLIVGEPDRTLENWVFWTKMALVVTAASLTAAFAIPIGRNPLFWDARGRRIVAGVLGGVSILAWIGIVFCGRWIAYAL